MTPAQVIGWCLAVAVVATLIFFLLRLAGAV